MSGIVLYLYLYILFVQQNCFFTYSRSRDELSSIVVAAYVSGDNIVGRYYDTTNIPLGGMEFRIYLFLFSTYSQ